MRRLLPILLIAALAEGCATVGAHPGSAGASDVGIASYVARSFDGRPTSSGAIFDGRRLTAAHRTLPFGTRVRVTNMANGRSVVVTIIDRGPFRRGRIIDVSRRAARDLDFVAQGTARVRLEVLGSDLASDR